MRLIDQDNIRPTPATPELGILRRVNWQSKPLCKQCRQRTHLMSVSVPEDNGNSSNAFEVRLLQVQPIVIAHLSNQIVGVRFGINEPLKSMPKIRCTPSAEKLRPVVREILRTEHCVNHGRTLEGNTLARGLSSWHHPVIRTSPLVSRPPGDSSIAFNVMGQPCRPETGAYRLKHKCRRTWPLPTPSSQRLALNH